MSTPGEDPPQTSESRQLPLDRNGPPPPPSGSPAPISFNDELRQRCAEQLDRFEQRTLPDEGRRRAAVAITLLASDTNPLAETTPTAPARPPMQDDDPTKQASFLLTRRAPRMSSHAGQYALPGGRLDQGETTVDAALRELEEEVGIVAEPSQVLGLLDDYPTRSGYVMTPVVVWVPGQPELVMNPGEVAEVFHIGLHELLRLDSPRLVDIEESDNPMIQLPNSVTVLHAPTAAVVHQFGEVCLTGRSTRVSHLEAPVWAWK